VLHKDAKDPARVAVTLGEAGYTIQLRCPSNPPGLVVGCDVPCVDYGGVRFRYFGQNTEDAILWRFFRMSRGFCAAVGAFDGVSLFNAETIVDDTVAFIRVVLDGTSKPSGRIGWE